MAQVEYRQLGKSGLKVSVPILGAMGMGLPGWMPWVLDEDKALSILKAAYDKGVNTWDTANVYSNGISESIMGKAIKKYNIPRHKVVLMTKCYGYVKEDPMLRGPGLIPKVADKDSVNSYGLSRSSILHAVEASLARLQTSYIDILEVHRFDPTVPILETVSTLHSLVESGKVRYIGASSMWAHEFALMQFTAEKHNLTPFVLMENYHNLLYREEEREMNKFCDRTGVGRVAWAPLGQGALTRPIDETTSPRGTGNLSGLGPNERAIIGRVQEVAAKKGWPMIHVALAWLYKRTTSAVIGFTSAERIDEAIEANGKELTKEEEEYLEELYVPRAVRGHM